MDRRVIVEGRPARKGRLRTAIEDTFSQASALVIAVISAAVFAAIAFAGATAVGRLGTAGWLIYGVVMTTFALIFGPLVASAVTLHQKGNARWRAERDLRLEADRLKYGLITQAELRERAAAPRPQTAKRGTDVPHQEGAGGGPTA